MKKNTVILVLIVGLAFVSSLVIAGSIDECDPALKLTPEQKEKMQKVCLDFQKEILPFQSDLKAKSLDMKTLLQENADLSKINAKIDELAKIKAEIMKKKMAHSNQIKGLLTEEQKALFNKGGCSSSMGCGTKSEHMNHGEDKSACREKTMKKGCCCKK
ncbi:MAG: Spy/CpxP family protein refolding chaperone [Acidobacteriota bacterium]